MKERTSPWQERQTVEWPNVNPYTIVTAVGAAGNVHVAETGRWHVYWHRNVKKGRTFLLHNGGPDGFPEISKVRHQYEWVLLNYTGVKIKLPPEDVEEFSKELIIPHNRSLAGVAKKLEDLEIPGEQQSISQWIQTFQNASRDLPQVSKEGEFDEIRRGLEYLLGTNLGRSTNIYKKTAADALAGGLQGTRGELLLGLNEGQRQLLFRSDQILDITLGVMKRYQALHSLERHWVDDIRALPRKCGYLIRTLEESQPGDDIQGIVERNLFDSKGVYPLGLLGKLRLMTGQLYFSQATRFLEALDPVTRLWDEKQYEDLSALLRGQVEGLEVWSRRAKEETEGIDFTKYELV